MGYEGPTECLDINECQRGTYDCHIRARCINNAGAFSCECLPGYDGSSTGRDCYDIDECSRAVHHCHPRAKCANRDPLSTWSFREGAHQPGVFFGALPLHATHQTAA